MDRAVVTILGVHEITPIVRILHPLSAWIGAVPGHSKPQCFGDPARLEKRLNLGARREMQCRRRHAPSQNGRYRRPMELARNAKNPGKTRVLLHVFQNYSGEDRNRTFECFPNVFEEFERCFLRIPFAKNSAYGSIKQPLSTRWR